MWYKTDIHLILLELLASITDSAVCYTLMRAMHKTPGHLVHRAHALLFVS